MTAMPQLVALLNGFGGIASLLVASSEHLRNLHLTLGISFAIVTSIFIGGITFTGSILAYLEIRP